MTSSVPAMLFLTTLGLFTLAFLSLAVVIWFRTRNLAFPVGLGLLYYWTYYGAWFVVVDRLRGFSLLRYEYLYAKLFPIYLDDSYFLTIVTYGVFLLAIEAALVLFVVKPAAEFTSEPIPRISHVVLISIATATGLLSYYVIRGSLGAAADMNVSSYEFVRLDDSAAGAYKIHQLLMRVALFSVTAGLAVMASGRQARVISSSRSKWAAFFYVTLLGGLFYLNLRMGQRRALAAAAISAGLLYLVNVKRASRVLIFGSVAATILAMGYVGMTRGGSLAAGQSTLKAVGDSVLENLVSNEPFAAHLSLYGSIAYKLEPTHGSSLLYLASSIVPGAPRPMDIYEYYTKGVHAIEGQGYNVHHAAAWYLNFGIPGVIAGGFVLGTLWAALFLLFQLRSRMGSHILRIFAIFGVWMFTADIPTLCRTGPEGYKGMLFEALLIPTAVMLVATLRPIMMRGRPVLAPALAALKA